jgi:hypothetical protein
MAVFPGFLNKNEKKAFIAQRTALATKEPKKGMDALAQGNCRTLMVCATERLSRPIRGLPTTKRPHSLKLRLQGKDEQISTFSGDGAIHEYTKRRQHDCSIGTFRAFPVE